MTKTMRPRGSQPPAVRSAEEPACPDLVDEVFVRALREALATKSGFRTDPLVHHLSIASPGGGHPVTYTFRLGLHDSGAFVLTCPQAPRLIVLSDSEEEALDLAMQAIRELATAPRGGSAE